MMRRKQVIAVMSVAVASFLFGTMFSFTVAVTGDSGSPWDNVWTVISELESKVETLEDQSLPQGFVNAPAYDSGWVLSDGQIVTLNHNLGTVEVCVYFVGSDTDSHDYLSHNGYGDHIAFQGEPGGLWGSLNTTHINVYGLVSFKWVRVMLWKILEPPT